MDDRGVAIGLGGVCRLDRVGGFAMGMMFTPLSTLALANVPRHKMAQASGLFNVIRQVGGSFGVALFGTLLTRRVIFHSTTYGIAVSQNSPAFNNAMHYLEHFSQHAVGGSMYQCTVRGKALIINHVEQQAFVSAVNDDFLDRRRNYDSLSYTDILPPSEKIGPAICGMKSVTTGYKVMHKTKNHNLRYLI